MSGPSFWWNSRPSLFARLLSPLGYLYGALAALHGAWRSKNAYYASVPVISVGNLTAGGAGKTPVVQWLAQHLTDNQTPIAIVSRGYGGTASQPIRVDSHTHTAAEVGDEPLMLARHFSSQPVSVWVGRHRPSVVRRAEQAGAHLIILDDGFQRRDVARDIDILVINGTSPWGNSLPLPAGPLRETLTARKRASFAIVINEPSVTKDNHYGIDAYRLFTTPTTNLADLVGKPLIAFAGLAHPTKFFETLRTHGLNMVEHISFSDHHRYTTTDLASLSKLRDDHHATLITTAKDAVKLPLNFAHILDIELEGADQENILAEIAERLR